MLTAARSSKLRAFCCRATAMAVRKAYPHEQTFLDAMSMSAMGQKETFPMAIRRAPNPAW
jgi:hypothetical protein